MIDHAFAIVGEFGREDVWRNRSSIQIETITSERRRVESRALNGFGDGDFATQVCSRLGKRSGIAEALIRKIARRTSGLPLVGGGVALISALVLTFYAVRYRRREGRRW